MQGKVIFSYEESYGYMLGDYVRDKDAVTASVLLTEMAAWYAGQGMTLYDALQALFEKYGYYGETHPEPGHARPGRPEEDGRPDGRPAGAAPGGDRRRQAVKPQKDYKDGSVVDDSDRRQVLRWSSPVPTCCAMRWPTAPA